MPQNFASPWAAAGSAIFDYLAQRDADQRQAMLDSIVAKREERLLQATDANTENQRAQTALAQESARGLQDQRASATAENRLKTVLTRAGTMAPNTDIDEGTAGEFEGVGLQHLIRRQAPQEAPAIVAPGYEADAPQAQPGILQFAGLPQAPKPAEKPITAEVGRYLLERQADGTWKQVFAGDPPQAGGGADGAKPYFTTQTVFDAQGRPTGAIRTDHRTGEISMIEVPGGGQLKPPPGNLAQRTIENEATLDHLGRLETMFNQGAKDLIGPVEGRARALGQAIPGVGVNPMYAEFEAATTAFKNGLIKAITGAQMSEPEAKRIMLQIPDVTDKPEVWTAKAAQTAKNIADLERRLRSDRDTPVAPSQAPSAAPAGDVIRYGRDANGKIVRLP